MRQLDPLIPVFPDCNSLWTTQVRRVLASGARVNPRGRETREIIFVPCRLSNPRDRLLSIPARRLNPFFLIGEWLWILRGSDRLEVIHYYLPRMADFSDDGIVLHGAYGPRLFGTHPAQPINQIERLIQKLVNDPLTRQAVLAVYLPQLDWQETRDVPCLSSVQFMLDDQRLHCMAMMRSQDLYLGMPYDVAWITLLHEYIAIRLGAELGEYTHICGSAHLYEEHVLRVEQILRVNNLESGTHCLMAAIPRESSEELPLLLKLEGDLRTGDYPAGDTERRIQAFSGHWRDVAYLLLAYKLLRCGNRADAAALGGTVEGALGAMALQYLSKAS